VVSCEDVVGDLERETVKLLRNGTRGRRRSGAGTARLTAALALTGLLFAALAAFGAARYATSAAAQAIPPGGPGSAQYEYRPGWGCGDRNHIHTGPPGAQYQYATPPPGCAKARAAKTQAAKAKCTAKVAKAKAKANASAKKAKATKRKCGKAAAAKRRR
jgi:hypothetical protein